MAGTTIFDTTQLYTGPTTISGGTLRAGAANIFGTTSAFTVASGGTFDLAGFDQTLVSLDNAGMVNVGGAPGTTLTVSGNYVGSGGTFSSTRSSAADNSPTDQLIIGSGGSASGATGIVVTNVGGAGAQTTGAGIALVVAQGGATTAPGAFALAAPVAAGPFQYLLFRGNDSGSTGDPRHLVPALALRRARLSLSRRLRRPLLSAGDVDLWLAARHGARAWRLHDQHLP